jgi:hypothetical protein
VFSVPYNIDSQLSTCQHPVFPEEPSKGNTATATILLSSTGTMHKSTVTCLLHCSMAESDQKEMVQQLQQQQKCREKMRLQSKVTAVAGF